MAVGFQFKQFFIAHDQCAMKVNTDGILLGAIADVKNVKSILDLGTGTGLVAIMLAQRTAGDAQIIGLELDPLAFTQAQQNAANSPWASQILLRQGGVLAQKFANSFDLIVSNPPYFEHSPESRSRQRDMARIAMESHFDWLKQSKNWLTPQGKICFILPFEAGEKLIEQAQTIELYCTEKWAICTKMGKSPKRVVLNFELEKREISEKWLDIYDENNQYTLEFRALTQDFYLNF